MLHSLVWQDNTLATDVAADALAKARHTPGTLIWLDLNGDLPKHRTLLARTFGLSSLTVSTILDPAERARFSVAPSYFYLIAHSLTFDVDSGLTTTPKLDIVFCEGYLITAHATEMPWLDVLRTAARKGQTDQTEENIMSRGIAYLLYAVLDHLTDSYFPVLDDIDDVVDDLENLTVVNTSNEVQARIFRLKRSLAQMRRVISPQVEVANALITRTGETIPREMEPYFADVHDHLVRAFELLDSYRDLMSGLLDVYLTTVSNRLNAIMKQLTLIATIFLPLSFLTGFFGQNFGWMVDHVGSWEAFVGLGVGIEVFAAGLMLVYFRRRGWF
jgi:magnesium transporter